MKFNLFICSFLAIALFASCQNQKPSNEKVTDEIESNTVTYDSIMAIQLGADPYGMKAYIFAFLKSGPYRTKDSIESAKLMRAHLNNISKLKEEGKLVLAGPFLDGSDLRGIYIFNTESLEEAKEWTNSDPAIQAGSLIMELKPWYGSASLGLVKEAHKKIQKTKI